MTKLFASTALALLIGVGGTSTAQAKDTHSSVVKQCPGHVHGVYYYRNATRSWERKIGRTPSKSSFNASNVRSCQYVVWVAHTWAKRAVKLRNYYVEWRREHPVSGIPQWLRDAFMCIHSYEGAWTSNTGNGYYGGMQMDWGFMRTYGPEFVRRWGSADNWPVEAQLIASARAHASGRGFTPWPNTARACGLL